MFQAWRWKLRAAEEALAHGRLHEASRLLREEGLLEFLPGQRLAERVAERLAEQARTHTLQGDTESGWQDWDEAQRLLGDSEKLLAVRQEILAIEVRELESHLAGGHEAAFAAGLKKLVARPGARHDADQLREIKRLLELARDLASRGKYAAAAEQIARAKDMRPTMKALETLYDEYVARGARVRDLTDRLHRAMAGEQWTEVAAAADALLEIAPQLALARDARRKAWATVGARPGDVTQCWTPATREHVAARERRMGAAGDPKPGSRFLLWVDAVGAFLVSLEPTVTIGQAVPGSAVDLPILGDLSRQHARIRREGDGYLIEPLGPVWLRGQKIDRPEPLADGDEVQLGDVVRLRFRQPHALSATARLDFVSRHRTPYPVDSILLLAESCVLGPRKSNHVLCRDWSRDVILYRKDENLYCRTMDSIEVDGQVCDGRGQLSLNSRIAGEDFSLSLEPV